MVAGEEVCFDVTGAVGMSTDPVCNGMGSCAPLLDLACNESANVHWDFTGCLAFAHNTDFSEFTPTITESCSGVSVSASIVEQIGGMHSCTSDVMTGAGGEATCVPVRTGSSYNPSNIDRTLRFDVTVTESEGKIATLEEFSFFHSAPTSTVQHQTGGSPVTFSNDPPTLYALRVLRDGTQVFLLEDIATSAAWVETAYDFATNPSFQVTSGSAQFTFELQGYAASGNSAQLRVWDIDEFDVSICCGEDNSTCPSTVVLSANSVQAGAMGTPMLPADSSPASSVTSNVCWTPGAGDVGTHTFDFLVTDCKGETSTCSVDVIVVCDLEFSSGGQPSDQSVCVGDDANFLINVDDNPPATTQWFRDGVAIPGATNELLTLTNVQVSDGGVYTAVVTNLCGSITSMPATLTVKTPPSIDLASAPIDRCLGESLTLAATVTGTAPITYSWTLDGNVLAGETGPTLTINSVGLADAGSYMLTATNECGTDMSSAVVVTIESPPAITAQPMGQTVCEGDPVTLMVTATGSSPLTYQWFLDGAAIGGATSAMLNIPSASQSDAGNYTVVVTNDCGSATSMPAPLTVRSAPAITTQPTDVTDCEGATIALSFMATGSSPLTITWSKDGTVIPGANMSTLTINGATPSDAGS